MNVKYYYYPPKNPQFFFPKIKFKEYQKYYSPFSLKSKLFWILYKNSILVRFFFKIKEKNIPLPIVEIQNIINLKDATYFYNLGTKGYEQKATIIAKNNEGQRFLKFAQKKRAKDLVKNEALILLNIENAIKFKTPKLYHSGVNEKYAFMLTEVILGTKVNFTTFNDNVLQLLFILGEKQSKANGFLEVFSHGDFCPWNMLITQNQELVLIDWEMAEYKVLGYDLFTFIFQTNFLIFPNKNVKLILLENNGNIKNYFSSFKIEKWEEYLVKFAEIKVFEENKKPNSLLLSKYKELLLNEND